MFQSLFSGRAITKVSQVDAVELSNLLEKEENLLLVDVRSPQEYQYEGHIEGARLLPLQALMQRIDELPKDQPIIFVCRSGNRSLVACEQLSRSGYENVTNFRGGMIAWKRAGLPTR